MTAQEARDKFGGKKDGYIRCPDCPIYEEGCDVGFASGYEECWNEIAKFFNGAKHDSTTRNTVNHPAHYNQGKYECIDVMVETFGREAAKNFCLLNAFKYVWRTGEKNGREDIEKAVWYLNKYLELGKGEENEINTSGAGA